MNDDWLKKHKEIHDAFSSNPRGLERSGVHLRTYEKVSKLFENVVKDQAQAHDALSKSLADMRFQRNVWLLWSLALLVLNVVFASI